MKYNSIGYLIGEGFRNVLKNKKSTGASLIIMCMAMLIFGMFFIIGQNINHIMSTIEEAQGMQVFIKTEASDERIAEIRDELAKIEGINKIEFVSKEQALNEMKENLQDKSGVLDGMELERIPASYMITLTELELNESVQEQIMKISDID